MQLNLVIDDRVACTVTVQLRMAGTCSAHTKFGVRMASWRAHSVMLCLLLTSFAFSCSSRANILGRRGICTYFQCLLVRILVSKRVDAFSEYERDCSFLSVTLITDVCRRGRCDDLKWLSRVHHTHWA